MQELQEYALLQVWQGEVQLKHDCRELSGYVPYGHVETHRFKCKNDPIWQLKQNSGSISQVKHYAEHLRQADSDEEATKP